MAACPRCGEGNPARARFCLACGAPLEEPAAPREMRKTVTVVFSDVIDSTPLGERLDAETYRRAMSRYFIEVSRVLEHHGGTVEKFIGDAVMAVFGIPIVHEDDALRAVRAATELRQALAELNETLREEFGMELSVRTGINTGEVVAGDPAEGQAFATGDPVVVAQRLESSGSAGEILIGDATFQLVREAVLVEPVEPMLLMGKSQPVVAWRLLGVLTGAPAFARRLDAPMVGRERELGRLRAAFDEAAQLRECRVIKVIGSAGIGKSRLVDELLAGVKEEASVLRGRCLPYGEGITYWPLRDLVREAAGDLTKARIEKLLEGEPDAEHIAARVAGAIGIAGNPGAPEETMWAAVRRLLGHIARDRPLIIAFDDLQWAEPTFLDLIEYLVGWSREAPILIVCLTRPDLADRYPGWLTATPQASSVKLEPLSGPEAEVLLDLLRGETELTADLFARITDAAEGNPLFVEQMLAMLTENGSAATDLAIPPTIHALLAARLDRLDPEERAVIERASVIGKEFWRGAVADLTPEAEREAAGARLMTLARKEFVEPSASIFEGEDGFQFRHILIRDAAYLGIPKEARADLHERYAGWLLRTTGERASELDEILGYHLEQAYRYRAELGPTGVGGAELASRAGERLGQAGRRAMVGGGDVAAAASLISRAVSLLPVEHALRRELLTELGSALMMTGDFARAEGVLEEAVTAATAAGDARWEARALIEREFHKTFAGSEDASLTIPEVTAEAIPILEEAGDHLGLARAWRLRSEVDIRAAHWGARAEALERALGHARQAGDVREEATIIAHLAQSLYYGPTPVEEAIARCEEFLTEGAGDRSLEASTGSTLAGLRAMRGDFDEARRLWAKAGELYEALGLMFRRAARSTIPASIETLAGDPEAAERELRWGYDTLERMAGKSARGTIAAFLAEAVYQQGREDEAKRFTEITEELAADDDLVPQVVWRSVRAKILAGGGELHRGEELAREAAALVEHTDFPELQASTFLDLAEVLAAAGKRDEAKRLVARAKELYERKGNVVAAERCELWSAQPIRPGGADEGR
jgi:class 3 adenylate cyclase/tetratricopeptide (TPR) repeat protein